MAPRPLTEGGRRLPPLPIPGITPPVVRPTMTPVARPMPMPTATMTPVAAPNPVLRAPVTSPGFVDTRSTLIQPPGGGGGTVAAPGTGPRIGAQNPTSTYASLDQALAQSQSPEQARLRQMGMAGLQGLSSLPDRAQLAASTFKLLNEQSQPGFEQDMRRVGQNAAAFGRTGSGMTTNELTDLGLARGKAQSLQAALLANEATTGTIADRMGIFDRTAGYQGQVSGEDRANAGFRADIANNKFSLGTAVRGQNVGERDYQSDQGWRRAALAQDQQARGDRNAWAGTGLAQQQQGFQAQQAQQAIDNAARQQALQEALLEGDFGRRARAAQLAGGVGYGNDPYQMQLAAAQGMGGQAAAQRSALEQAATQAAMQRALAGG